MSHIFFAKELECVTTFWRVYRRDGVALAFTSHDRDLYFDGINHLSSPGITPSSIRKTPGLGDDSMQMSGALSHASLSAGDIAKGRYDGARVEMGAVDWETGAFSVLYSGEMGGISQEDGAFSAELISAKAVFDRDFIPRTSPTCRAEFCGRGCNLSASNHTAYASLVGVDTALGRLSFDVADHAPYELGSLVWLGGEYAGTRWDILSADVGGLVLDMPMHDLPEIGARARLLEGCDQTFQTCGARFQNSVNFQGEPFLPGNDLLARYPQNP